MRFTYSLKRVREVRKFHVSIVQRRLINLQKRVIHVQSCCFANTKKVLVIKNTKYFFAVRKREATTGNTSAVRRTPGAILRCGN